MANSFFFYEFEELPVHIEGGYDCGLVSGQAEISYSRDGSWSVVAVALDGYKNGSGRKTVWLDNGTPLHLMIVGTLEGIWERHVCEAVQEQLNDDRDAAAEMRYEARRDDMRMGL